MRSIRPLALILAFACPVPAAEPPAMPRDAFEANRRLGRGVNLGNALEAPKEGEWGITLKEGYFEAIQKAGFDSVRIPVRWATHTGEGPLYLIEPAFFERIDWAIDQCLARGLVAVLNVHHDDQLFKAPAESFDRLKATWLQVGARYKDRPAGLFFELLNEPHDELTDGRWQAMFPVLLAGVRGSNPTRPVIVGPGHWNSFDHLRTLDLPANDRNLIATFHYYNPFHFTHQGAPWAEGSEKWKGETWSGTAEQVAAIRRDFDRVALWGRENNRPIYLGEFGAYSGADLKSRVTWTDAIAREAERLGFSWSYWEFASGFGVYDPAADSWREPLLKALLPPKVARP